MPGPEQSTDRRENAMCSDLMKDAESGCRFVIVRGVRIHRDRINDEAPDPRIFRCGTESDQAPFPRTENTERFGANVLAGRHVVDRCDKVIHILTAYPRCRVVARVAIRLTVISLVVGQNVETARADAFQDMRLAPTIAVERVAVKDDAQTLGRVTRKVIAAKNDSISGGELDLLPSLAIAGCGLLAGEPG